MHFLVISNVQLQLLVHVTWSGMWVETVTKQDAILVMKCNMCGIANLVPINVLRLWNK